MFDESRNVFFAHIPKTGGSSIEVAHGFPLGVVRGCPYRHQREIDLKDDEREVVHHRFTVVRNTYERIRSTYVHLVRFMSQKGFARYRSFASYLEAVEAFHLGETFFWNGSLAYHSEDEVTTKPALFDVRHIQKIGWWLCGNDDQYIILRFENLADDYLRLVSEHTGITSIPHENITPPELVRAINLTLETQHLKKIEKIFGDEIGKYGFLHPQ